MHPSEYVKVDFVCPKFILFSQIYFLTGQAQRLSADLNKDIITYLHPRLNLKLIRIIEILAVVFPRPRVSLIEIIRED